MLALNSKTKKTSLNKALCVALFGLALSACGDDNDAIVPEAEEAVTETVETITETAAEYSYTVTVTNLTYAQPLSPIAVLLHDEATMWSVGETASVALEKLAEGGDNSDFIADSSVLASSSSEGLLSPGSVSTITINTTDRLATNLTIATMLVNTNDAFSGLTGMDISAMAIDDNKSWNLNIYDSGTELNSEAQGTIPGPADDGGTGYDSTRDDVDFVSYHSGVVSQDDGLSSSVLTQAHRFDNPAIKVTITRTQ